MADASDAAADTAHHNMNLADNSGALQSSCNTHDTYDFAQATTGPHPEPIQPTPVATSTTPQLTEQADRPAVKIPNMAQVPWDDASSDRGPCTVDAAWGDADAAPQGPPTSRPTVVGGAPLPRQGPTSRPTPRLPTNSNQPRRFAVSSPPQHAWANGALARQQNGPRHNASVRPSQTTGNISRGKSAHFAGHKGYRGTMDADGFRTVGPQKGVNWTNKQTQQC